MPCAMNSRHARWSVDIYDAFYWLGTMFTSRVSPFVARFFARQNVSLLAPPSRRGRRADQEKRNATLESARPGRSCDTLRPSTDLPGRALIKVALHFLVARRRPSSKGPGCPNSRTRPQLIFHLSSAFLVTLYLCSCTQQMAHQPRYDPLEPSNFFPNGSSARPLPLGVVAYERTQQRESAANFPIAIDTSVVTRGQQRYNIYCSPCHDYVGTGNGMAAIRGFRRKPASFHSPDLLAARADHFFDVITNGFGAMPSYANQIPAEDRWAIIAYIRALQLSQSATMADVPPDERKRLEAEKVQ
jgi:mono/diheme cytochrome c family protein